MSTDLTISPIKKQKVKNGQSKIINPVHEMNRNKKETHNKNRVRKQKIQSNAFPLITAVVPQNRNS